jgi:hypothetical protein
VVSRATSTMKMNFIVPFFLFSSEARARLIAPKYSQRPWLRVFQLTEFSGLTGRRGPIIGGYFKASSFCGVLPLANFYAAAGG